MATLLIVAATEPELAGVPTDNPDIARLVCGVGPVDAALATARALANGPAPAALIHIGIAGCRRASGLDIGTIVLGSGSHYCDTSSKLVVQQAQPDPDLLRRIHKMLPHAPQLDIGMSAEVGGTQSPRTADVLVEAMEGFSVLRAAETAGVPAIEIRAISNYIEDEDRGLWRFDLALAALNEMLGPLLLDLAPAVARPTA